MEVSGPLEQPLICAAHPASEYTADTANLIAGVSGWNAVCINPRGTLEQMVDALEDRRLDLGVDPWVFWGMSGGGWLAQLYAHRHPDGLRGIIVESACRCFAERLSNPECILSPHHPMWESALDEAGLLDEPGDPNDGEWRRVEGVGEVFATEAAHLVSPAPVDAKMREAMPMLLGFDARPWLADVEVPALVFGGDADSIVPVPHVEAVRDALQGAGIVVPGGHVPTSEGSDPAKAMVRRWLADLAGIGERSG